MYKVNQELVKQMLHDMPESKKATLRKALERNLILTSSYVLSGCTLTIYKEGFLVQLDGTRCSFSVYAKDDDGDLVFMRKPNESTLHKLYSQWQPMDESDYRNI